MAREEPARDESTTDDESATKQDDLVVTGDAVTIAGDVVVTDVAVAMTGDAVAPREQRNKKGSALVPPVVTPGTAASEAPANDVEMTSAEATAPGLPSRGPGKEPRVLPAPSVVADVMQSPVVPDSSPHDMDATRTTTGEGLDAARVVARRSPRHHAQESPSMAADLVQLADSPPPVSSVLPRRSPRKQAGAQSLQSTTDEMDFATTPSRRARSTIKKRRAEAEAARIQLEQIFASDDDGDASSSVKESSGNRDEGSNENEDNESEENEENSVDKVKPSSRPCIVQDLDTPVAVTRQPVVHADWAEWASFLITYQESTMQVIRVSDVVSSGNRNKRLTQTKAAQRGEPVRLIPDSRGVYQRTYICTYGWQPKPKTGGDSKRPRRHIRFTACPFRFVVQMSFDDNKWCLKVKNGVWLHNHPVSDDTYPTSRGAKDPDNVARVETMVQSGVKQSRIYDYLLEHGENIIKKDVDNLVDAHQTKVSTKDDDEATAIVVAKFVASDEVDALTVDETAAKETGVLSVSSRHMREMLTRFPELLLVDCTHKTNRWNYQLCTFMVVDEYGDGQVAQQSCSRPTDNGTRPELTSTSCESTQASRSDSRSSWPTHLLNGATTGFGVYSREQIETMLEVVNLRQECSDCNAFCTWLANTAAPMVSANKQDAVRGFIVHVSSIYPSGTVQSLVSDYHYAMLYRLAPPQ